MFREGIVLENGSEKEEWKVLSELPRGTFTLLLKHRSDIEQKSLGLFDLQLSGHTHRGQFFPFGFLTKIIYNGYDYGLHNDNGFQIYITSGAGTWGPPIRIGAPPEIVVIRLK